MFPSPSPHFLVYEFKFLSQCQESLGSMKWNFRLYAAAGRRFLTPDLEHCNETFHWGKSALTCMYSDVKNNSGITTELCVIVQHLRDPDGNQYSPYEYSLQQSADGSVLLVPRTNSSAMLEPELTRQKHKEHDPHHKEWFKIFGWTVLLNIVRTAQLFKVKI